MSNYYLQAKSKISDQIHKFEALDNYFGLHRYGYKSVESGIIFNEKEFEKCWVIIKPNQQTK